MASRDTPLQRLNAFAADVREALDSGNLADLHDALDDVENYLSTIPDEETGQ